MSSVFERFLTTPEMVDAFSEQQFVQAMLRFEAALTRAQAQVGLIPNSAAQSIIDTCNIKLFDVARIVGDSGRAGSLAIPLVKSLRETVALSNAGAAAYVHFGATSQDVIDTALVLVTRDALALIEADVRLAVETLLKLAMQYVGTPVLARTLMQPASITSFGFKCTQWAAPLVRSLQRLQISRAAALRVQLGGAVGTLAQMQAAGAQIRQLMAQALGLSESDNAWHTQRDDWVALGCELGVIVGSLGKIAKDITLMSQFEVAEVFEPSESGRGGSSAMPHKRNPVACMVALAASVRAPQRVAAMLAAMPQEHERALGNWQAELAEWPGLVMATHGAARAMAQALSGLQVDPARMRANIDTMRAAVTSDVADVWFNADLASQAAPLAERQADQLQHALQKLA